ncbi:hypothetical protein D1866_08925 [Acidianus ambivalens]|uniref:Uncharacterized protein n=1 Tax=Acidianus ambivalens TaxID=2283 RepID=A0A650CWN4_ACIAM|nr:hypothetical protein D1866_08925 [Acidianus ambivalens]
MSNLLSFLDNTYYNELSRIVKKNLSISDEEVDKFLEELLRQYLERRTVNNNDFTLMVNSALLKIRILDKLAKRNIVKNADGIYRDLYEFLNRADKNKLKNAFVYVYIKARQYERMRIR